MAISLVTSGELEINDGAAGTATRTIAITLGTRTNGGLIAKVIVRGATGVTSISATWNGTAMSVDIAYNPSSSYRVVILSLPVGAGDTSSRNLVVTFNGINTAAALQAHIVYEVYDGMAQSAYADNTTSGTGTSTTPSASVTPSQDNCLVTGGLVSEANNPATVGSGEIITQAFDGGAWVTSAEYAIQTTAGAQVVDWTTQNDFWAVAAACYRAATGGTPYTQSVAGTLSSTGALARGAARALTGATSSSGALTRESRRVLTGSAMMAGTIETQSQRRLAGVLDMAGALARSAIRLLSGELASAGTVEKRSQRALEGALSPTGSLIRQISRRLIGTVGSSGIVAGVRTFVRSLDSALSLSGVLARLLGRVTGGSLATAGTVEKQTAHTLVGALAPTGAVTKSSTRALAGALATAATLQATKLATVALAGALAIAGTLQRQSLKTLTASLATDGMVSRTTLRVLGGALGTAGTLLRQAARALSGLLGLGGSLSTGTGLPQLDLCETSVVSLMAVRSVTVIGAERTTISRTPDRSVREFCA